MSRGVSRREWIRAGVLAGGGALGGAGCVHGSARRPRLATFSADVTVPIGHGMMGGAWLSRRVVDPLEVHGFVLMGCGAPVVYASVDWCEIRNDAYLAWQVGLAEAAGTTPDRVLVSTIHQHDAPVVDLGAEALLRAKGLEGTVCDPAFHAVAVARVATAVSSAIPSARRVTHFGVGKGRVERVASNRRYDLPDGTVRWDRTSATRNVLAIEAGEGLVDPWLRMLTFWDGADPLLGISFYAVHPMSHYGQGDVSADFPGQARRLFRSGVGGVPQIYASGCSGNVTAGKYNDGSHGMRPVLAGRLRDAMDVAWRSTERRPIGRVEFRSEPVVLEPRGGSGFTEADLEAQLVPGVKPFQQCLAAMGLSWRKRVATGRPIQIPCLDLGEAALVVLPGESYVEYQLAAQTLRPKDFICVAGYGDGATGYIPTETHWRDRDTNLGDWCWVAPGSEARLKTALARVLGRGGEL